MSDSATPWIVAIQAPLSMGLSRQRILEWLAISFSRDLPGLGIEPVSPGLGIEPVSPALAGGFFTTEPPG